MEGEEEEEGVDVSDGGASDGSQPAKKKKRRVLFSKVGAENILRLKNMSPSTPQLHWRAVIQVK